MSFFHNMDIEDFGRLWKHLERALAPSFEAGHISPETARELSSFPTELERVAAGLRHGMRPNSDKAVVYCWLDRGLPQQVVSHLVDRARRDYKMRVTTGTVATYGSRYRRDNPSDITRAIERAK